MANATVRSSGVVSRLVQSDVEIEAGTARLSGSLMVPQGSHGLVIFAHGSGSGRHSPRNRYVAEVLNARGLGTLLFDLLTQEEELLDAHTAELRFDVDLLASRLTATIDWTAREPATIGLRLGLFGASTGAAAALMAAAERPELVNAVVSRGGRPDLASSALPRVLSPTLLIVGSEDEPVARLNREAAAELRAPCALETVPGATHLFDEAGKLEIVAQLAADWFATYLRPDELAEIPGFETGAGAFQ